MRDTKYDAREGLEARWRQRFGEPPPIRAKASLLARILNEEERLHPDKGVRNEADEALAP